MASKYSVIQFVPNAISGECVNIGVLAFDANQVKVRFLSNWARVRQFAGVDVDFLKDLADEFEHSLNVNLQLPGMEFWPKLNEELVQKIVGKWQNSVQLTAPRTSLKAPDVLIENISSQFLTQIPHRERTYRDRRTAASIAKVSMRTVLEEQFGRDDAGKLLHTQHEVNGRFGPHVFDAVIANGSAYAAVQAMSFELPEASELDQLVDAVAFQVFDIRQLDRSLPIGILALPPKRNSAVKAKRTYDRARRTYEGLHADFITEKVAATWVKEQVKRIKS